ncbi:hypothetical protein I3843_08G144200 [Carya illinoinensis]|uniref:Uncharacterized protein n=1 Tax=Carya illinoinensis TaxID=32201 RepID=A0A922JCP8_CARIL|nr:hypothetical protein I3760_08G148100 [Carya illinoinensis]KAG6701152.1 hypothetical protein I3842_08G151000 [Carya illinoinensis]KAG7968244.1 hypothetical protein I3843_08G144200 [Carya illinoinensis]
MGNSKLQKKSSGFSSVIFSVFKARRPRSVGDQDFVVVVPEEAVSARKVYISDYDKRYGLVADHKVDSEAEDFIKKVHNSRRTMASAY